MSLREELLFLRAAARTTGDPAAQEKCFQLLRQGEPYDQLFFGELSDPAWLPALTERGFFRCLPLTFEQDGVTRHTWHLPLQSLPKLAGKDPKAVARLLRSMHIPANPASQDQAMRAVAAIKDPACIGDVLPVLQRILQSLSTTNWLWLDEVLGRWLEAGAVDACFDALATFLRTAIAVYEERKSAGDQWRLSEVDEKVIVPLADKDPLRIASLLSENLIIWAESERARAFADRRNIAVVPEPEDDPVRDFPGTYWIEDFKVGSLMDRNVEGILAHRLYFVGETIFRRERAADITTFDALLRGNRWHLFARLRWQLYADFPAQTLAWARRDILARLPQLGRPDARHEHEMAEMLKAHVAAHGNALLDENEVERFAATVLDTRADDPDHEPRHRRFQRRLLSPIAPLLRGDALTRYRQLSAGQTAVSPDEYKPWHLSTGGGVVEELSPFKADRLGDLADAELWRLLNEWAPSDRSERSSFLVEETVGALGKEFAFLVRSHPERFPPASRWWEQLRRPAILSAPLELATARLNEHKNNADERLQPSADEWLVWLGLAARLADPSWSDEEQSAADWEWPRIVAAKFLWTICLTATPESTPPADWPAQVHRSLDAMMRAFDPRLDGRSTPFFGGWQSAAINSVRGVALEGLLQLAFYNEKNRADPALHAAVFRTVAESLDAPETSPALFAIVGSNLRLTVHLFAREIRERPALLLPPGPSEHKTALLTSHFLYDRPMVQILTALPDFPQEALDVLAQLAGRSVDKEPSSKDYGGRVGTYLAFYEWNRAFPDDATGWRLLDTCFRLATPQARASTISDIGRIFSGVPAADVESTACQRVMAWWERRFAQIKETLTAGGDAADFRDELGEFFDWFECEGFPFEWRAAHLLAVIDCLEKAPRSFSLLDKLKDYSAVPDRLDRVVEVFHRLLGKPSEELRWSYQTDGVTTLLERGFASADPATRRLTLEAQERLLRQGLFEYLDVAPPPVPSGSDAGSES